ncbi:hypothetical protein BS50DRAFT_575026 [Corynespora cassiicola Philippines]|uniref:Uncharacterized protein n=1 Tax=Corynespora cassiicola Philippines TaxID=1448308 RepID=A0A2T2NHH0_CORCC|nr:hypothetical protein BS50DRAFT_575026 [Corynespora cassiicola Philippines]
MSGSAQPAPVAAQPAAPAPTNLTPSGDAQPQDVPLTYRQKLDVGHRHWISKLSLRIITILGGIIGIGCMAYATATNPLRSGYWYIEFGDDWTVPWTLITFAISVVWSVICVLVFLLRQRPVHPGCQVGIDLILWLAFIPTAMFALVGLMSLQDWGSNGIVNNYSSDGYYRLADNGTWVWKENASSSYYNSERDCESGSSYYSYNPFSTCAEEEAYVNRLWQMKPNRVRVETAGVVLQFLCLLIHLALFIWACVDTHRRNSQKVSKEAEQVAAEIVMNMVKSGAIIQAPGQAHMPGQPPVGQFSTYPQQTNMQPLQNQRNIPQQYPVMPAQAAITGNEKSEGSRYA